MFERAREKYKDDTNKILIAKAINKYEFAKSRNKITYTDFLNITEISLLKKIFSEEHVANYIVFGGNDNTERNLMIFYPEKFSIDMIEKNYDKIFKVIRINNSNDHKMEHREYLSGIMKLGIRREKIGDILVFEDGADIIMLNDIAEIIKNDLMLLTRFKKSNINILDSINEIRNNEIKYEDLMIIVSSIRLDSFVAEIVNCSRTKAEEIIKEGRVFINSINELKSSKKLNINDIITVRGKGKYIFSEIDKETRSGRQRILLKKYK